MVAEVIINSSANSLNKTFDYNIPEGMFVCVGMRVLVPFANRKENEIGYVVEIKETSKYKCKGIIEVADDILDESKISIAKWIAKKYFCNIADALRLFMPPGTGNNIKNVKAKTEKWVSLIDEINEINLEDIKSEKQKRIIQFLIYNESVPISELLLFTDTTINILKTLEKNGYVRIYENEIKRNPFKNKNIIRSEKLKLTGEQENVINSIKMESYGKYLIYGITGSGKTEIYMQLIEKILEKNKTAIILVPEISLTPQITDRFLSRFGNIVAILHSRLSIGERYDEWRRIKEGEAKIVIGARSAIFAPLSNIGIIIIDEEHDSSYKSEMSPKYDAREIAGKMSNIYNIPVILGSATPDVNTYYMANTGEVKLLKLENRINKMPLPEVKIVDMRDELANGNKTVFSRELYNEINKNIENKEQTILFLNRRGYSTFVMCRDCGYVVKCKNCDISLTYHKERNKLLCHYCGITEENINICPNCGSTNIRYFGTGTQKIETEINKYFPNAKVIRMDIDTTKTKNAHEVILQKFKEEKIDILLGTQMIAKGHDFENITLVGVLAADTSINIADYRANERTYQLLTQVCGRAGRGKKAGRAIIQTYMPDEFSIIASSKQDYEYFYSREINMREKLKYPPFCDIIVNVLTGPYDEMVKQEANKLFEVYKDRFEVYPPMPAPISKVNGMYRWRIIFKKNVDNSVIDDINICINRYNKIKDSSIKLNIDINPNNMM